MTRGNTTRLMLRFLFPMLLGNLFQQIYHTMDALIVGHGIGVQALAAVGATHGIHFVIMGFVTGCTQGVSIVTAKYFGAGDAQGVRKSFATCLLL